MKNGTYQTKVNLLTKLMYIAAAISIPLISGRLWMFGVFIAVSLLVLASGKILKKTVPLIFPVVMRFLINTRERAIALEVRGFGAGKKKTWLAEWTPPKGQLSGDHLVRRNWILEFAKRLKSIHNNKSNSSRK